MNYWIFKANPQYYRLDERLSDPEPRITWSVTRYKDLIRKGDLAFIWRTGTQRGICALMSITSYPEIMEEIESEKKYALRPDVGLSLKVKGVLSDRFKLITSKSLKEIPSLESMSVFYGFQQSTNFRITADEAATMLQLIAQRNNFR